MGRSSLPCGYHLTDIPTIAASLETLRVQTLLNERLSGKLPIISGEQILPLQYFHDLRALCAFILYCAEPDDLCDRPSPENLAFRAFVEKRDRILVARKEAPSPRNSERMRLVYARQENPVLMAAIAGYATEILEFTDSARPAAHLRRLTDRLIARTKDRWEVIKFFGFSNHLSPLIEKSTSSGSHFDRAIGYKATSSRETICLFGPQHVPQLLWQDEFDQRFKTFFPHIQEISARRFCAMALVKLCGEHTWEKSALELQLPVKAAIKMVNRCMTILGAIGLKEKFSEALHEVAASLSKTQNKIDYRRRRRILSTFSDISVEVWSDICRTAGITVGHPGRRSRYAAAWLWTQLTGGDWRLAPGLEGENTESARTVYNKLNATIMPRLAPHLHAYGSTLLQATEQLI